MRSRKFMAVAAVVLLGCLAGAAGAAGEEQSGIHVSGVGVVTIKPDCAHVVGGVAVDDKQAGETVKKNATSMASVLKALDDGKIAKQDVKTVEFDLSPRYAKRNVGGQEEDYIVNGYRCVSLLSVTVRNPDDTGKVIDMMAAAGCNQFRQVTFSADQKSAEKEALQKAMAEAREKAEVIAAASGVSVGDVVSVTEHRSYDRGLYSRADRSEAAVVTGIAPGSKTVSVTVSVTYKVGPKTKGLPDLPPAKTK